MGRRNQLKMTGLSFTSRIDRAEKRRLEQEEKARQRRERLLKALLQVRIGKP